MVAIGVEIGDSGGIALTDKSGEFVDVVDMPTLNDEPKGRPAPGSALRAQIVARAGASSLTSSGVARGPRMALRRPLLSGVAKGRPRGRFGRPRNSCGASDGAAVETAGRDCARPSWGEGRGALRNPAPLAQQGGPPRQTKGRWSRRGVPDRSGWVHAGGRANRTRELVPASANSVPNAPPRSGVGAWQCHKAALG